MSNPILADLAAAGFLIEVEHHDGVTSVRVLEPKADRAYTARGDNEFMAAMFAKGKVDLDLADEPATRRRAA